MHLDLNCFINCIKKLFSSKASVALLLLLLCVISALPAIWCNMQCKHKPCTQKCCTTSLKLKSRGWIWSWILVFGFLLLFSSIWGAPSLNQYASLSANACLFQHLWSPLFSLKHTKAGEDADEKWCLTNILLRRHLILITQPKTPGATEVCFKAESHIGISSTLFTLACRANSLGISVYISVCVSCS